MTEGKYRSNQDSLIDKISALEKRIAKLERMPRIGRTAIDKGDLTVNNGNSVFVNDDGGVSINTKNGDSVAFIGRLRGTYSSDDAAHYIQFSRADGSLIIDIFSDDQVDTGTSVNIKDKSNSAIFSDNTYYGGLRDPRFPASFVPDNLAFVTSASTTLVPIARAAFTLYHYVSYAEIDLSVPGGTAGELVMCMDFPSDTSILSIQTINSTTPSPTQVPAFTPEAIAANTWDGGGLTVFSGINQDLFSVFGGSVGYWARLCIYVRRTSGAGTISAKIRSWENGGS